MPKAKPKTKSPKASRSRARRRPAAGRLATRLRRAALALVTAGALSTQLASCAPSWARLPAPFDGLASVVSLAPFKAWLPSLAQLPSLPSLRSLAWPPSLPSFSWPPSWPPLKPGTAKSSVPSQAQADARFADCPQHFPQGIAPAVAPAPQQRALCYDAFAVLHQGDTRTPLFVAERINRQSIEAAKGEQRTNRFFADARLPRSERAELSDYKGSGYARGHMAPAGNMPNATAMAQSFSLANMVPQDQRQNSGPWSKIEQDTRRYAERAQGDVFVITGPVFGPDSTTVGANQVRVPTHLFKLVYDATTQKAWVHWQPNAPDARVSAPISYHELERRTGMALLPGVRVL